MPSKTTDFTPLILAVVKPAAIIIITLIIGIAILAATILYLKNRRLNANKISGDRKISQTENSSYAIRKQTTVNPPTIHPKTWTLELLKQIEWKRFEEVSAQLMRELGFRAQTNPCGADGGVDIKLYKDGSIDPDALIQCKAWNKQVGVKEIRELLGVITHQKTQGIFMTTNVYSQEAENFGKENKIDLIDGKRFLEIVQTMSEEKQNRLLNTATEGDYTTPTCASCGIKMARRTTFWGCTRYPKCHQKIYFKAAAN